MAAHRRPPGPKLLPIVGGYRDYQRNPLGYLAHCSRNYGDVVYTHFLGQPFYLLNHPDYVRQVLVEQPDQFRKLNADRRARSTNLADSEGVQWQRRRKLIQPAFHHSRVLTYGQTMTAQAAALRAAWRDGETVEIGAAVNRMTSAIAAQTLLSADMSHFFEEIARIVAAGQTFLVRRRTQPLRALAQLIRDWDVVRQYSRLNTMILELVKQRRAQGSQDSGDLLSMLLLARDESGDLLNDQEVASEAIGLFIAGHETTANALTWTFYLLAQHPTVQAALADELDRVLAGRLPTPEDPLPYTEMVVKEAMRLYPPAWVLVRRARPGAVVGGYTLNPHGIVALSPYALHRDPRFFPDPETFDPQRFAPEHEKSLPRYAYFPFGGGPRVCIGSQFAMLEARLALATLVQGLRVHLAPGQTITPEPLITLRPAGPVYITLAGR